ncbi:Protein usg [Nymphon striatum]|nr:Protein usg [Nymphon striatum]
MFSGVSGVSFTSCARSFFWVYILCLYHNRLGISCASNSVTELSSNRLSLAKLLENFVNFTGYATMISLLQKRRFQMAERETELMLRGYGLTTAEFTYHMPDFIHVLNVFVWQDYDLAPDHPRLFKFIDFWQSEIRPAAFGPVFTPQGNLAGPMAQCGRRDPDTLTFTRNSWLRPEHRISHSAGDSDTHPARPLPRSGPAQTQAHRVAGYRPERWASLRLCVSPPSATTRT